MDGMRAESRLVDAVVGSRALADDPVVAIDVGCGLGIDVGWRCFGPDLRLFGFDPDLDEIERLAAAEQHPRIEYTAGWVGLPPGHPFTAEQRGGSYWGRNPWARLSVSAWALRTEAQPVGSAATDGPAGPRLAGPDRRIVLDEFLLDAGVTAVDFVKLDVDGPDFEVLVSLDGVLAAGPVLGVGMEVNFFGSGAPTDHTLHNTDRYLKERGFELFDLSVRRYSTAALPARFALPVAAETVTGRILQGDALYFRDVANPEHRSSVMDVLRPTQLLKLACLFDLCGLADCAAEILVEARERLQPLVDVETLLDTLVPEPWAATLTYRQYLDRFGRGDPMFFPEPSSPVGEEPVAPDKPVSRFGRRRLRSGRV
jgi:methyltransferase FkbM-like protein